MPAVAHGDHLVGYRPGDNQLHEEVLPRMPVALPTRPRHRGNPQSLRRIAAGSTRVHGARPMSSASVRIGGGHRAHVPSPAWIMLLMSWPAKACLADQSSGVVEFGSSGGACRRFSGDKRRAPCRRELRTGTALSPGGRCSEPASSLSARRPRPVPRPCPVKVEEPSYRLVVTGLDAAAFRYSHCSRSRM